MGQTTALYDLSADLGERRLSDEVFPPELRWEIKRRAEMGPLDTIL